MGAGGDAGRAHPDPLEPPMTTIYNAHAVTSAGRNIGSRTITTRAQTAAGREAALRRQNWACNATLCGERIVSVCGWVPGIGHITVAV